MTVDEVIELANLSLQSRAVSNGFSPPSPMSEEAMDVMFESPTCETLPTKDGESEGPTSAKSADRIITNDVETILKHMSPKSAESTKRKGVEMLLRGLKSPALRDTVTRKFAMDNDGTQLLLAIVDSLSQPTATSVYLLIGALKSLTYLALHTSCVARQVRTKAGSSSVFGVLASVLASGQVPAMPAPLQRTLYSTAAQALTALCEKNPANCKAVVESGVLEVLCRVLGAALDECRRAGAASFGEHEVVMVSILRFFGFLCSFGGSVRVLRTLPLIGTLTGLVGENAAGVPQSVRAEAEKTIKALARVSDDMCNAIRERAAKMRDPKVLLKLVEGDAGSKGNPFSPYSVASPQKKEKEKEKSIHE